MCTGTIRDAALVMIEYLFKLSPALAQKCLLPLISLSSVPIHVPQESEISVSPLSTRIAMESNGTKLGVATPSVMTV